MMKYFCSKDRVGKLNLCVLTMARRKMGAENDRGVLRQGQLVWAHARTAKGPSRTGVGSDLVLHLARNLVA